MHFCNTCRLNTGAWFRYISELNSKKMETKKVFFSNIKGMLSRDQMRQIKGGSGGGSDCKDSTCSGGGCDEGYSCRTIDCCDGDFCSAYLTCVPS